MEDVGTGTSVQISVGRVPVPVVSTLPELEGPVSTGYVGTTTVSVPVHVAVGGNDSEIGASLELAMGMDEITDQVLF